MTRTSGGKDTQYHRRRRADIASLPVMQEVDDLDFAAADIYDLWADLALLAHWQGVAKPGPDPSGSSRKWVE